MYRFAPGIGDLTEVVNSKLLFFWIPSLYTHLLYVILIILTYIQVNVLLQFKIKGKEHDLFCIIVVLNEFGSSFRQDMTCQV